MSFIALYEEIKHSDLQKIRATRRRKMELKHSCLQCSTLWLFSEYPGNSLQARSIMLMIQNNLDPAVAQHPHELITYGGNGSVFQNWIQYRLTMKYLAEMTDEQTLVMYSGHPMGLFPSHPKAPRVVLTNGMMIPNYSKPDDWEKFNALGVTQYGQMTAGSYMYIGPQGIVHGTTCDHL
jgi:urocanate hydratase